MSLSSKQRAYLRGLALSEEPSVQIGRTGLSPEIVKALDEALAARELVKINVQKNFPEEEMTLRDLADRLSERTHSDVVQMIGRKMVFYRPGKGDRKKIELPKR